jgi:hypothetical protein
MPAINAGLPGHAVTAGSTILPGQTGLATIPLGACGPLRAGLAVEAILAGRAILAVETRLAILSIAARRTVVTVLPVEAVLAGRAILAVETGFAAVTLRSSRTRLASGATRSGNTRLAAQALGASRASECRGGDAGETSGRAVLLPEMEIVPAAVLDIPNPKVTGGGIVIGISGLGVAGEAVNVIDKTENATDGGKTLDTH